MNFNPVDLEGGALVQTPSRTASNLEMSNERNNGTRAVDEYASGPPPQAVCTRTPRTLRIAYCPPEFEPFREVMQSGWGNATYIIQGQVAKGLLSRGHALTYLAPGSLKSSVVTNDVARAEDSPLGWTGSAAFDLAESVSWRMQRMVGIPYLNVFSTLRLREAALRCVKGHDLVYERQALFKTGVGKACRALRKPYVLFVEADEIFEHDRMGTPLTGLLRRRAAQMFRSNLAAASKVVCVSEELRRRLACDWRVPQRKITVLENAVDTARFAPDPTARLEIRGSLGLGNEPLVLFLGNFYPWHDVRTLLHAFRDLRKSQPDAHLLLVGDGSQRPPMMRLANDLGLAGGARFMGSVPHGEVPKYIAAADLSVVPYSRLTEEMWMSPLKLYESLSVGAPVIATAVGQVRDEIIDGRTGLLTRPEDAEGLCRAMRKVLHDRELARSLGAAGRSHAVANRSWQRYISRLETLFYGVVDECCATPR